MLKCYATPRCGRKKQLSVRPRVALLWLRKCLISGILVSEPVSFAMRRLPRID
jgi:hypothetical protein